QTDLKLRLEPFARRVHAIVRERIAKNQFRYARGLRQRHFDRDSPAHREADDRRCRDTNGIEQCPYVVGKQADGIVAAGFAAASGAAQVGQDQPVFSREIVALECPVVAARSQSVDQHQRRRIRIDRADAFVKKLDPVDRRERHADEYTVVRADTLADAGTLPEVTPMSGLRNQFVYSCIQLTAWRTRKPLAYPLLHTNSKSIQRMFAMNLALQTRRAVITLSLMALALVCVAAKTATRTDGLSVQTPMRVETMAIDVPAGPV